jgi:D-inositol-3-phosphate glycosyltransferase
MRQLRIAMISEHASPIALLGGQDAGGQNVYVDEISRRLARLGFQVDVFSRRDAPATPKVAKWAPGVRVVQLSAGPARAIPKDAIWPHMPAFRNAFLRFVAHERGCYDVLHAHFWMSGWVALNLAPTLGAPVVQLFHALGETKRRFQGEDDTSPPERIAVEREIVRRADRVIAQCPAERQELVTGYDADPGKIALIPAGANLQRFRPVSRELARRRIGLEGEGPVVVYVGRMLPRKDVRNVIRAFARLLEGWRAAPPQLLIVGGETSEPDPIATPEIGVLQRLAAELGIAEHVRFTGQRQPDELRYYYCAADVAVTTPWYEPFGLTPLEAMACGRPVIGSAVGGITYTIRDGETGYLVPPRDPDALARRLRGILRRPRMAERMGLAARERVEREFTWPLVAERTAALYDEVLTRRPHEGLRELDELPGAVGA